MTYTSTESRTRFLADTDGGNNHCPNHNKVIAQWETQQSKGDLLKFHFFKEGLNISKKQALPGVLVCISKQKILKYQKTILVFELD